MPNKASPEGSEDPLLDKYNSGLRMLLGQNIYYKVYAAYVMGNATSRSNLMREDLHAGIKKRTAALSPEEAAILDRMVEEELALIERKKKEKAAKRRPEAKGKAKAPPSSPAGGEPRPKKRPRKTRTPV